MTDTVAAGVLDPATIERLAALLAAAVVADVRARLAAEANTSAEERTSEWTREASPTEPAR